MDLFERSRGDEENRHYAKLAALSLWRQNSFLESMIAVALERPWHMVSEDMIKALNHHAIACLHSYAGEYRPCDVRTEQRIFPAPDRVPALMHDFVIASNRYWDQSDAVTLAAFALWRLNWIHPFVNGNGRTATAVC